MALSFGIHCPSPSHALGSWREKKGWQGGRLLFVLESCTQTQREASPPTLHSWFCFHPWLQAVLVAAPKTSCLWCPCASMLRKTKGKGSDGTWICVRGRKRAERQHWTAQDSFSSMPWVGGVPNGHGRGQTSPGRMEDPYLPSPVQQCPEQELLPTLSFRGAAELVISYQHTSSISRGF